MLAPQDQDGVVTRRQALAAGRSDAWIRRQARSGRWQELHRGVYATFSGPVPPRCRVWAAVLRAGPGAVAGPRTSLWLVGAVGGSLPDPLDVVVPHSRRLRGEVTFRIRRRRGLAGAAHPAAQPPRLRLEEAVLDVCAEHERPEPVIDLVTRVVQLRLTTPDRLLGHLAERRGYPRRGLFRELLADVRAGARSPLEVRWVRDVQQRHALPVGELNVCEDAVTGRVCRDVVFAEFGLVIENDGQLAHPRSEAFRDRRRDNRVTVSGRHTLRYGWREIVGDPCGVAAEVSTVLHGLGWPGRPRRCGPGCQVTD